jgi:hypothetical protein
MTDHDKQVDKLVNLLGCSIFEAEEIIASDKVVDKMGVRECESDLTPEQKATAKKYRQADRKIEPKKPFIPVLNQPKEKKKNLTKIGIISEIFKFLSENLTETAEITNESKIIEFEYEEKRYKLDLIERRKPKS